MPFFDQNLPEVCGNFFKVKKMPQFLWQLFQTEKNATLFVAIFFK